MSRRKLFYSLVTIAIGVAATTPAFAAKGGGGHLDPTSFAIATQAPGSITFSITTDAKTGSPALQVTNNCYDNMSVLNYSATMDVSWSSSTTGSAGPFSPPSGEKCYAYAHTPGSTTVLAVFSYVAL